MTKRTVRILDQDVVIAFNMATEVAYEEISGESFSTDALSKMKSVIALLMACIIANNPDTTITIEQLMRDASAHEIATLNQAVVDSFMEWCKVPTEQKKKGKDSKKN